METYKYLFFFLFFSIFLYPLDLKIASYNVENLFDMEYSGHEYDSYIPNKHGWNHQNFSKKILNTSEVICDVNADIIGLQEVENENVLKLLQSLLRKVGCDYDYFAITHKKGSAIQVALLSKYPIAGIHEIVVDPSLGYRNILEVKYLFNRRPLFVYVNHWKSKASPESSRMLSAKRLFLHLRLLPKKSEYILLGDFNSDYDEYLHIEEKHNDQNGKTGINHILKTVNSKGEFIRPSTIVSHHFEHYNLWLELFNYKRWSHNFYGNKQGLDAILLPSTLFDKKGVEYIDGSFRVFKKHYLFHKKGYIFRWAYKNKEHQGVGYSDHLPLVASFSTSKPFKETSTAIHEGTIEDIYRKKTTFPLCLKEVKVVRREKKKIRIRGVNSKISVAIYGVKKRLRLGKRYDICIYGRKRYQGHYEIVDFEVKNSYDNSIKKKD